MPRARGHGSFSSSCRSPHWLHAAQNHLGSPFTEAALNALSPKQVSPAPFLIPQLYVFKIGLSVLRHSCLVFHYN